MSITRDFLRQLQDRVSRVREEIDAETLGLLRAETHPEDGGFIMPSDVARLTWLGTPRGDSIFRRFVDHFRFPRREPIDATGEPWTVGVDSGGPNGDHTAVARHRVDENGHHVVDIVTEIPAPIREVRATLEVRGLDSATMVTSFSALSERAQEEIRRSFEVPSGLLRAETSEDGGFLMPSDVAHAMNALEEREEGFLALPGTEVDLPHRTMTAEEMSVLRRAEVELPRDVQRGYHGEHITPELVRRLRSELLLLHRPPAQSGITWGEEALDSLGRLYITLRSGPPPDDAVPNDRGFPVRILPVTSPRSGGVAYTLPRLGEISGGPEYHPSERAWLAYRRLCAEAPRTGTGMTSHTFRGQPFRLHGDLHDFHDPNPLREYEEPNPNTPAMSQDELRQNFAHGDWEKKDWLRGAEFTGSFEAVTAYLKTRQEWPLWGIWAEEETELST